MSARERILRLRVVSVCLAAASVVVRLLMWLDAGRLLVLAVLGVLVVAGVVAFVGVTLAAETRSNRRSAELFRERSARRPNNRFAAGAAPAPAGTTGGEK